MNIFETFDFKEVIHENIATSKDKFVSDIEYVSIIIDSISKKSNSPFIYLLSDNTYSFAVYYFATLHSQKIAVLVDPEITDYELYNLHLTTPPCMTIQPMSTHGVFNTETDIIPHHYSSLKINYDELIGISTIMFSNAEDGEMKAVKISYENIEAAIEACWVSDNFSENSVITGLIPFYHIYGLITGLILGTRCQGNFIITEMSKALEINTIMEDFIKFKLTNIYSVPMMFFLLSKSKKAQELSCSLEYAISGGYKLDKLIAQNFSKKLGIEIREGYGITEATGIVFTHSPHDAIKLNSVGNKVPQFDIKIIPAPEQDQTQYKTGEICLKGKAVSEGYYNNKLATSKFYNDGWLLTGDYGFIDEDGYLYLTGLKKRMLNVAGKNVYPAEVERFLYESNLIEACNIYGEYTGIFGHRVNAEVQLREDTPKNRAEIKAWCKANISQYKMPKRWEFKEMVEPMQKPEPQKSVRRKVKKAQTQA